MVVLYTTAEGLAGEYVQVGPKMSQGETRQTLMATNLAPGALVAWRVAPDKLDSSFNYMVEEVPFSGHVVIRSTDAETPGSVYRLWTTLKVPQGFSIQRHCGFLAGKVGADAFRIMPAKRLFALRVPLPQRLLRALLLPGPASRYQVHPRLGMAGVQCIALIQLPHHGRPS